MLDLAICISHLDICSNQFDYHFVKRGLVCTDIRKCMDMFIEIFIYSKHNIFVKYCQSLLYYFLNLIFSSHLKNCTNLIVGALLRQIINLSWKFKLKKNCLQNFTFFRSFLCVLDIFDNKNAPAISVHSKYLNFMF